MVFTLFWKIFVNKFVYRNFLIGLAWAAFAKLNTQITKANAEFQDTLFKSGMRLDIVVWQREMDTNGGISRETLHLCKDMLPDYAGYQRIAKPRNKRETLSTS